MVQSLSLFQASLLKHLQNKKSRVNIKQGGCKKLSFLHPLANGDRKKCFRTDKLSQTAGLGYPKAYDVKTKQTSLQFCFGSKTFAHCFIFPSPQKAQSAFRGPRKSQDFKGKRSNQATTSYLHRKCDISDCCDAREVKFAPQQKGLNFQKNRIK